MFFSKLAGHAKFSPEKMSKVDLAHGPTMFAGLNCFESGQEQALHAHAGQDKLYVVLEGDAEIYVGAEQQLIAAGGAAFAASGVPHSIRNVGQGRLIVLAVLAPPPGK
jgi:mannose-6-phosphate isomerase-like protein (cupin superfamily)